MLANPYPLQMSTLGSNSMIDKVWSLVMDRHVGIIGLYGAGGVGKTTLLKQIYNNLAVSPHDFEAVVWVTVSGDLRLEKIQDDIWKRIGIFDGKWVEKSFNEKAKAIFNMLREKRFLLFLDDLLEHLDFAEVGVPYPERGQKVVLTTRSEEVCHRMGAKEIMKVTALSNKDAWELFEKKVGEDILSDPMILHLAKLIVADCEGLPVLLLTVARAMACRTTHDEWKHAFEVILVDDFETRMFSMLNFCFDSLPNDRVKSCFLYYSLFPEDFIILKNNLIDFWICERLLGHLDAKEDILNLGYNTVDSIIEACLLLEEDVNYVKFQDVIREFALPVAIKSQMFKNAQFIEATNLERTKTVGWISSMGNSNLNLADLPPALFTFFVKHNPFIMIKGEFSQFLYALTVLDLSHSGVEEIPKWISELVSLQYLDLSYNWIEYLPIQLTMLTKLMCLNLEYDDQLRVIPKQLIYGLSSLQVLKMFRCGFSVEEIEENMMSVRNMDIDPLLCLEHLKVLSITITCSSALQKFFNNPRLLSCTQSLSLEVFLGSKSIDISPLAEMNNLMALEIHQAEDLKEFNGNLHHLKLLRERSFERLREVTLRKCSSLQELTWVILVPYLTILRVISCEQMQEIISIRRLGEILKAGEDLEPFAKLEFLALEDLPELKSIYLKALPFRCLKKIEVINCSLLEKLPLNSDSAKANEVVIEAEGDWWKDVKWEDDATKTAFLPCFKRHVEFRM